MTFPDITLGWEGSAVASGSLDDNGLPDTTIWSTFGGNKESRRLVDELGQKERDLRYPAIERLALEGELPTPEARSVLDIEVSVENKKFVIGSVELTPKDLSCLLQSVEGRGLVGAESRLVLADRGADHAMGLGELQLRVL